MEFNMINVFMQCAWGEPCVIHNCLQIWPISALIRMTKNNLSNHHSQTSTCSIKHMTL